MMYSDTLGKQFIGSSCIMPIGIPDIEVSVPDPNDFIRKRIRQAREEANLSQRELAERFGCSQVTMSDIERGVTRVSAGDLVRLSTVLGKSVLYLLPGVQQSDLTDNEQTLIALFRELDGQWQQNLLEGARNQVALYRQTKSLEALPSDQQEAAAYDLVVRLLEMHGVNVSKDADGRPQIDAKGLHAALVASDEKDRQIIETLVTQVQHGQRHRQ